jgi:hypothetical protein
MPKSVPLLLLAIGSIVAFPGPSQAGGPSVVDDMYHAVTTMRDVNSFGVALEAYWKDHKAYPSASSAAECLKFLVPNYAAHLESRDAWGSDIQYLPTPDRQDYRLVSAGSDRKFDESSWGMQGTFTDSKQDAVFSGHFLRKWAINFP